MSRSVSEVHTVDSLALVLALALALLRLNAGGALNNLVPERSERFFLDVMNFDNLGDELAKQSVANLSNGSKRSHCKVNSEN